MSFELVNELHTATPENVTEIDWLTVTYRDAIKALKEIEGNLLRIAQTIDSMESQMEG